MPDPNTNLLSGIVKSGPRWRAQHSELPITILFLDSVYRAQKSLKGNPEDNLIWESLRETGISLSFRRALFVAAEAMGGLSPNQLEEERGRIIAELETIVAQDQVFHKLRALSAVRFLVAHDREKCISILESGLQDGDLLVQERALDVLLHLDLGAAAPSKKGLIGLLKELLVDNDAGRISKPHQSTPRSVLEEFIVDKFKQQTERGAILDPEAIVKNFRLNKGLLQALITVPGVKDLALKFLMLWIVAGILTIFTALGVVLRSVFVDLPNRIRAIPHLWQRLGSFFLNVGRFFVYLLYKIITLPLWTRRLHLAFGSLRSRYFYLAFLDYLFICFLIVAGRPYGILRLAIAVAVFLLLLLLSMPFTKPKSAEQFRAFTRCLCIVLLSYYLNRQGHQGGVFIGILVVMAIHVVWLLTWVLRALYSKWPAVKAIIHSWNAKRQVRLQGRRQLRDERSETTAPQSEIFETVVTFAKHAFRRLLTVASKVLRLAWQQFRPRRQHLVIATIVILVFVGSIIGLSHLLRRLDLSEPQISAWRPFLQQLSVRASKGAVTYKPLAYLAVVGVATVIFAALVLVLIRIIWDELLIVERIRSRIRSRNPDRFNSPSEFILGELREIRRIDSPIRNRVRSVHALGKALRNAVPGSEEHSVQLYNLANEDLPQAVRGAILKEVEQLQGSYDRGRRDAITIDLAGLNEMKDTWLPGEVLRPIIFKGIALVLFISITLGAVEYYSLSGVADKAALATLVLGCAMLVSYVVSATWRNDIPKWSLLLGLLLISMSSTPWLHLPLIFPNDDTPFQNGVIGLFEISVVSSFVVPVVLGCVVIQAAHTIYLLGSDIEINAKFQGTMFERRLKRLEHQPYVGSLGILIILTIAVTVQSGMLRDYLELRAQKMPVFEIQGSKVELKGIPTTGRLVRVALFKIDPHERTASINAEQLNVKDITADALEIMSDGGIIPRDPDRLIGEMWFLSQAGETRTWSDERCLNATEVNADTVTFDRAASCGDNLKTRLVAIVYDKKRTDFIRNLAADDNDSLDPIRAWLLVDTYSPFVRAVWSSAF